LPIYTNVLFITPPNATKACDFHTELVAMYFGQEHHSSNPPALRKKEGKKPKSQKRPVTTCLFRVPYNQPT